MEANKVQISQGSSAIPPFWLTFSLSLEISGAKASAMCNADAEHQTRVEPGLVSSPCSTHLLLPGVPPVQGKSLSFTGRTDGRVEKGWGSE